MISVTPPRGLQDPFGQDLVQGIIALVELEATYAIIIGRSQDGDFLWLEHGIGQQATHCHSPLPRSPVRVEEHIAFREPVDNHGIYGCGRLTGMVRAGPCGLRQG
jgi:hypothetical protein